MVPVDLRAHATAYLQRIGELIDRIDLDAIDRVVQRLRIVRDQNATVFVAGNGGSAATASHFVNDLGKATKRSGRLPIRVIGLSDNIPWLTALANDEGYERVFAGQLENLAQEDDILIVLSASGNSPNLVRAVELAQTRGMATVAFLGFDGGALLNQVDECIWIPTERGAYGPVEDCHAVLCHVVATCLAEDRVPACSTNE